MIFIKEPTKIQIIKAIVGFTTWVIGTIILFKVDYRIAIGTTLITLSIYNDLKMLFNLSELSK